MSLTFPKHIKVIMYQYYIRSEIVTSLRKGTSEWYEALCGQDTHSERGEDLVNLITLVQIDLQQGLTYYHPLFET